LVKQNPTSAHWAQLGFWSWHLTVPEHWKHASVQFASIQLVLLMHCAAASQVLHCASDAPLFTHAVLSSPSPHAAAQYVLVHAALTLLLQLPALDACAHGASPARFVAAATVKVLHLKHAMAQLLCIHALLLLVQSPSRAHAAHSASSPHVFTHGKQEYWRRRYL
jgi:hypothetical protein